MRSGQSGSSQQKGPNMGKRPGQQLVIGQPPTEAAKINPKRKAAVDELLAALKGVYCNPEYNQKVFSTLGKHICSGKKQTGRHGMNLWAIFVLAQLRLCLGLSYGNLLNFANNHHALRRIIGVEREFGFERTEFEYQNIYDNVSSPSVKSSMH